MHKIMEMKADDKLIEIVTARLVHEFFNERKNMDNHNLEMDINRDGLSLIHWDSLAGNDKFFRIPPQKIKAYEQYFDADENYVEKEIDLFGELRKMAVAWKEEAQKEMEKMMKGKK